MKKFFSNLKTSDKITFLFTIFNFIWLLLLLFTINIIYFYIWYWDQKKASLYDMNINYSKILKNAKKHISCNMDKCVMQDKQKFLFKNFKDNNVRNIEAFKKYILKKDTIILWKNWKIICSKWVSKKIHKDPESLKDKLFYKIKDKVYFIYSKNYPEIWEVKVFFDTTPYVKSQIIIIKISLFIILISVFIFYFIWRKITKYSLKNLLKISKIVENIDIEKDFEKINISWNKDDEINILAKALNDSISHIKKQTSNLKQFITDVSHEFKTPLMIINSQIDLYNKKQKLEKLDKNETKKLLEKIKQKTAKLNNLLETFLFFWRVENNIEKLKKQKINFSVYLENSIKKIIENNEIIKNISKENSNSIFWEKNGPINIIFKIEKNIFIEIEKNIFDILLENLLSNAIKFSLINLEKNKKVSIEIWLNKKEFFIKDNWIWIDEKLQKNIFEKFSRKDTNIEWFGIWLFLVKRIVKLYSWKIKVESKKDFWTKFIIIF